MYFIQRFYFILSTYFNISVFYFNLERFTSVLKVALMYRMQQKQISPKCIIHGRVHFSELFHSLLRKHFKCKHTFHQKLYFLTPKHVLEILKSLPREARCIYIHDKIKYI